MNIQLVIVLVLLAAAIAMFALNRPRMDAVALIMLTVLPFTGVLTMSEALAGFSDSNIVLIAALFVIGEGLVRTGVARKLGDWLSERAGSSETRLIALLMLVVCGLGATMSSTAVTAIFIPVALRIAQTMGKSPRRLMMPISVAALISGMTTLIATAPNLVVNSELVRHGAAGFRFFSFTPFGVPILVLGVAYMLFARRWLAGGDESESGAASGRPRLTDWLGEYQLVEREHRVKVEAGSPLAGKTLSEIRLRDTSGASLIAIERAGKLEQPHANSELHAGDILFVDLFARDSDVARLVEQYKLQPQPLSGSYFADRSQELGMAEVIVPALSELVGKTVIDADFRSRFRLTVIGLRRGQTTFSGMVRDEPLQVGDTLLVTGPWEAIRELGGENKDLVVFNLPVELDEVLPVSGKAVQAVVCLAIAVGLMISGLIPNVQAALVGCLLMGALGCVDLNSAYRSIDWKTIVLIVGMLPFSIALERTGGVELAADGLMTLVGGLGPRAILATLFAITAILGMFISNTATAVLMAPIAVSIADELHASPYPFAMIVALAASTAFMTPVSSPVNTLVVTPGNYTFGDFIRIGVPFSLIVLVVSVIMVPWLLPL
ncbi:MAG: SLC13 family permease [Pirellulales bacterium]